MTYVTYECTICRRSKSFLKDNTHVLPNQCMITKGCLGTLLPIGETQELKSTPSVDGLQDWYARGTARDMESGVTPTPDFSFSTSSAGSIVLAVRADDPSTLTSSVAVEFEQKRVGDIGFQQFTFKVISSMTADGSTIVSGRDATGHNLRFDQAAIDESRVVVRVNGVPSVASLQPNRISISPALAIGATVDVLVYAEKSTIPRFLNFTLNTSLMPSLARGSWSNVSYVQRMVNGGGILKWYLYSADDIGLLTTGKLRVVGNSLNNDAMFLLASTPYQSVDRYLNFVVPQAAVGVDFLLSHTSGELIASTDLLTEIFPPLEIPSDAYISADLYTTTSTSSDDDQSRFNSKKILGPL